MSVVTLLGREGNVLRVAGLDVLGDTPLLDVTLENARAAGLYRESR